MNTNETNQTVAEGGVTELGIASLDTKGGPYTGEPIGGLNLAGISDE